jgi:hypothetical protein
VKSKPAAVTAAEKLARAYRGEASARRKAKYEGNVKTLKQLLRMR